MRLQTVSCLRSPDTVSSGIRKFQITGPTCNNPSREKRPGRTRNRSHSISYSAENQRTNTKHRKRNTRFVFWLSFSYHKGVLVLNADVSRNLLIHPILRVGVPIDRTCDETNRQITLQSQERCVRLISWFPVYFVGHILATRTRQHLKYKVTCAFFVKLAVEFNWKPAQLLGSVSAPCSKFWSVKSSWLKRTTWRNLVYLHFTACQIVKDLPGNNKRKKLRLEDNLIKDVSKKNNKFLLLKSGNFSTRL